MVVIKSKLSGYYFRDFGIWTPEPFQAVQFPDERDARGFVHREALEDVRVVDLPYLNLSAAA